MFGKKIKEMEQRIKILEKEGKAEYDRQLGLQKEIDNLNDKFMRRISEMNEEIFNIKYR